MDFKHLHEEDKTEIIPTSNGTSFEEDEEVVAEYDAEELALFQSLKDVLTGHELWSARVIAVEEKKLTLNGIRHRREVMNFYHQQVPSPEYPVASGPRVTVIEDVSPSEAVG
jgi:hypothetical protein